MPDTSPKLVLHHPPQGPTRELELSDRPVVIGRDQACDLVIDSRYVSRQHARVEPHGLSHIVVELAPTNPLLVNSERVRGFTLLNDGDQIQVADANIEYFRGHEDLEATAVLLDLDEYLPPSLSTLSGEFGELSLAVVMTRLVHPTRIRERLGDSRAAEYLRVHHALVRQQLAAASGLVIESASTTFMGLFDGPAAAVRGAVGVQQRLDEYNYEHPSLPIGVAIGLDSNDLLGTGGPSFETTLLTAQSLSYQAPVGEILVSERIRAGLEGGESTVTLVSHGPLEVAGSDELCYAVERARAA